MGNKALGSKIGAALTTIGGVAAVPFTGGLSVPAAIGVGSAIAAPALAGSLIDTATADTPKPAEQKSAMPSSGPSSIGQKPRQTQMPMQRSPMGQQQNQKSVALEMLRQG